MSHHNADKRPVEWDGKTIYFGPLSADRKQLFCRWLEPRYVFRAYKMTQAPGLDDEMRRHASLEHQMAQQLVNSGGIYWNSAPSVPVATALMTPDGVRQIVRILTDDQLKDWDDARLQAFLEAKDPDRPGDGAAVTDYQIAMDAIWETADPKAPTGSPPSPAPAGTTGSSPALPPGTSGSPATTPAA